MKQRIEVECRICHGSIELEIEPKDYIRWKSGTHIQHAMPYLTPGQRELLISNTCEPCFDKMFPPEDYNADIPPLP